ncbi:MAG: hypothetical protein H7A49_14675 [Akkermansiaceae bacterium]|nr:hypothetical protein [Akkermansiaceae bacterium]MCP5545138.1 hypothetical protein [Akkermansiaceae bacterium]MCP5546615.1 hypothetical protein [Akkermansiaceae bacterium]
MRFVVAAVLCCLPLKLAALPNSVVGPVFQANSPLNGQDLTQRFLAADMWQAGAELPGEWQDEGRVASSEISHLLARPKLFGNEVVLLRAVHRDDRLIGLEATFVDAGSFFGYFDEELPADLDRRARRKEIERRLAERQREFQESYLETLGSLTDGLASISKTKRPDDETIGRTRVLRAEVTDYPLENKVLRLIADGRRLIRVIISQKGELPRTWLDPEIAELDTRERAARLREAVVTSDDGTVSIENLRPLPQGYRPYCGLNSLAMAARHFGLHIDEDWLAVAGQFQNTGSADGSRIVSLYPAVASEAGFGMDRSNRFDATAARRALANGFPVIVWRRFSQERDQLHTRFARSYQNDPGAVLPDPAQPDERASWPGKDAPLHASVLTGYHDERREFLFLESWSGRDKPRRMRAEELAATAYLTFVFHP